MNDVSLSLYSVHCGFYDDELSAGIYEFHINLPVVAANTDEAKSKVRLNPIFKKKKMHIDGIEEVKSIDGYRVQLVPDLSSRETEVVRHLHRDL
jgi:hypothetical protein